MAAVLARPSPADPDLARLLAPPRGPDELGRLDGYRAVGVLGGGGMGLVLEAEDGWGRRVALKVPPPGRADEEIRRRFRREARVAALVKGPHVLSLLQQGEVNSVPYLVLPLLRGETLEARLIREGRLPVAAVLRIARQAAEGLAAVHEAGVIHRDVKPANLWLEAGSGSVKLFDFGLARCGDDPVPRPDAEEALTQYGATLGTPGYMAPEQIGGGDVDTRADLFSFGCVLYRMVTGKAPFAGQGLGDVIRRTVLHEPEPPRSLNPAVPPDLDALIRALLAKDRAARPASAREVAGELRRLETAAEAPPQRRKTRLVGVALAALALAAAAALFLVHCW
jgi:serine/threonine protein kinase